MAKKPLNQLSIQARTAGHIIQLAVEELLPEHHTIGACDGEGGIFNVVFSGFIDQINLNSIQNNVDNIIKSQLPIVRHHYSAEEFKQSGIIVYYQLPKLKKISTITIGEYRPVTDGGTTLSSTSESWPITLTEFIYDKDSTSIHYQLTEPTPEKVTPKTITQPSTLTLVDYQTKVTNLKDLFKEDTINSASQTKYLGKNGLINQLAKYIPQLSPDDRKDAGQLLNQLKKEIESTLHQSITQTTHQTSEFLDVTAPADLPPIGHLHLISQAITEIESIFSRLGFVRRRYPEIESDWYYAEGLNIPKNHPARDDQETFYFSPSVVLTAHTSNGQLREMELIGQPPIKMINIGKTYRRQASNTHSPMFHQFEGLVVDKNINITHLIGVSNFFAREYFGPDRQIRLRPHHFQFTEPSFEVDINCHLCKGKGVIGQEKCKVCKSGWLELGGAGMVHPQVLKNGGLDPNQYSGFAFGWGVERVIMMKHRISDNLRDLYSQDLRFLNQS